MSQQAKETTRKFLRLLFHDYYKANSERIVIPDMVHMREFGMESWDHVWHCDDCKRSDKSFGRTTKCPNCGSSRIHVTKWTRHLGYRSEEKFIKGLIMAAPHSVYHSAAFYDTPVARPFRDAEAGMSEKGWKGAELVFDIDADHLDSPCMNEHDAWKCNNPECLKTGHGSPPVSGCPRCGGTSFNTRKWVCSKCLDVAKKSTMKIYDNFLVDDFGFSPDEIKLNYSGHRGYHIRVNNSHILKLDSSSRVEIVHYITGMGFCSEKVIVQRGRVTTVPTRRMPGWAGKIADAMVDFIRDIDSYTGKERWAQSLRMNKAAALEGLLRDPPILSPQVKGVGMKSWQEIATKSAILYGGNIDAPVTHDIHRVIRLIGSLNGKTGFIVNPLDRDELTKFDPFTDALAFTEGMMKVKFIDTGVPVPRFKLGEEEYGTFTDETLDLPIAAAVLILCKGVATIE